MVYSGKRIAIIDPTTGEIHEAEIFARQCSALSELTAPKRPGRSKSRRIGIGAHVRMFRFFDGVPKLLVPDNLKSGVNKASFYDPEINRTYGAMAAHYSVESFRRGRESRRDKAKASYCILFD